MASGAAIPWAAVERALVERADDDAPLLRRRALAVLELVVDDGLRPPRRPTRPTKKLEQWRRWLTAASAAEYESGHHLVAAAADAFFDIKTTPGLEAKWLHALARRLLRHRNPAARKAFLQRLLDHAAPAEVADWPLVRDAVLPALDDNELRKSRDVARRCDAAAVDFVARFYRAAPAETRAAVVAYALRGGGRPRARAALLGPFEDLGVRGAAGPAYTRRRRRGGGGGARGRRQRRGDARARARRRAARVLPEGRGGAGDGGRVRRRVYARGRRRGGPRRSPRELARDARDRRRRHRRRARGRGRRGGDDATFRRRFRVQAAWSERPPVARYRRQRQPAAVHGGLGRGLAIGAAPWWLTEVLGATVKSGNSQRRRVLRSLKTQWRFGAGFRRFGADAAGENRSRKFGAQAPWPSSARLADAVRWRFVGSRAGYSRFLARESAASPANNWRRLASRSS